MQSGKKQERSGRADEHYSLSVQPGDGSVSKPFTSTELDKYMFQLRSRIKDRKFAKLSDISKVVVDSGCSSSMVTAGRYQMILNELKRRARARGETYSEVVVSETSNATFCVAGGDVLMGLRVVKIPIEGLKAPNFVVVDSLDVLTPPLLGGDYCHKHQAWICYPPVSKLVLHGDLSNSIALHWSYQGIPLASIWRKKLKGSNQRNNELISMLQKDRSFYATSYSAFMVDSVVHNLERSNFHNNVNESAAKPATVREYVYVVNAPGEEDEVIILDKDEHPDLAAAIKDPMKMKRLHCNSYHYTPQQLAHRYRSLLPAGSEVRKQFLDAATAVYDGCKVCHLRGIAKAHPKTGGLIARGVNQIVVIDSVDIVIKGETRSVLHMMDVYSRFSMAIVGSHDEETTVKGLILWSQVFGKTPNILVADFGSEFENDTVRSFCRTRLVDLMHTPVYSPSSNGIIERGNRALKVFAERIGAGDADQFTSLGPDEILAEACCAKNGAVKRFGVCAHSIALGYPSPIEEPTDTRGVDEADLSDFIRQRLNLRAKAGALALDHKLTDEIRSYVNSQCHENEASKLRVGDKVEILPESAPGELKKKRFWKQGTIRGEKGMKIVIVEFGNGKYSEVHRKNLRPLQILNDEHDRLVDVQKINKELADQHFLDIQHVPIAPNLSEYEEKLVSAAIRQRRILQNILNARTTLTEPTASMVRGRQIFDDAMVTGIREVVVSRAAQCAPVRKLPDGTVDGAVVRRLVIGFGNQGSSWVIRNEEDARIESYIPLAHFILVIFLGDPETMPDQDPEPIHKQPAHRGRPKKDAPKEVKIKEIPQQQPPRKKRKNELFQDAADVENSDEIFEPPDIEMFEAPPAEPVSLPAEVELPDPQPEIQPQEQEQDNPTNKNQKRSRSDGPQSSSDEDSDAEPLSYRAKRSLVRNQMKRFKIDEALSKKQQTVERERERKRLREQLDQLDPKRRKYDFDGEEHALHTLHEWEETYGLYKAVMVEQDDGEFSVYLHSTNMAEPDLAMMCGLQTPQEASWDTEIALLTSREAKARKEIPIGHALKRVDDWKKASLKEVQALIDFGVLSVIKRSEIPPDAVVMSTRWVVTQKVLNDGETFMKARLVARGYEQDDAQMQESVTANRDTAKLCCAISVQNYWEICSLDARTAFLQSDLSETPPCDRRQDTLILEPPKKGNPLKDDEVFRIADDKTIYGTREAPTCWNNSLTARLRNAGWRQSTYDLGLWFKLDEHGVLCGLLALHVDDSFVTGTPECIEQLKNIGSVEWGACDYHKFKFCGVWYEKDNKSNVIRSHMNQYVSMLETIPGMNGRADDEILEGKELSLVRGLVGQLLWLSKQRTDVAVLANQAAQLVTTVAGARLANKAVRYVLAKEEEDDKDFDILYRRLPECEGRKLTVLGFSDANFTGEKHSNSGIAFFLAPTGGMDWVGRSDVPVNLLRFSSRVQRRVAKSAKIAELQSSSEAHSQGCELQLLFGEMGYQINVLLGTDSEGLFRNVYSNNPILAERRFMGHLRAIRESYSPRVDPSSLDRLFWLPGPTNPVDALTKWKDGNQELLLQVLREGLVDLSSAVLPDCDVCIANFVRLRCRRYAV